MPSERYYLERNLTAHELITLKDVEYHHLVHVMRATPGTLVELINGQGALAYAEVLEIKKHETLLRIESVILAPSITHRLILAQGMPKMNHLEWIIEKSVELGVTEIWLFPGVLSEKTELNPKQLQRLEALIIAAMKQSGRLWKPSIQILPPLNLWKPLSLTLLFGDVDSQAPLLTNIWVEKSKSEGVAIIIGPEKGLHPKELYELNRLGAQGVKLNSNILRTETAAICALSLLSALLLQDIPK